MNTFAYDLASDPKTKVVIVPCNKALEHQFE